MFKTPWDDLLQCEWICQKVKNDSYAQKLYAAFCNTRWVEIGKSFGKNNEARLNSYTWRDAGALVAEIRGEGNYLDWYCSGIEYGAVREGTIDQEIANDLQKLGWKGRLWKLTTGG